MTEREQSVRLRFLVALTAVSALFAATNIFRSCQLRRERTTYVRTEERLRDYVREVLKEEEAKIEDFARAERGRLGRDAAALLVQARALVDAGGPERTPAARRRAAFDQILANFHRLQDGEPAVFPVGKPFLRAHYMPLDGSFRPYSVCLPRSATAAPDRALPLVVTLSGTNGSQWQDVETPCYEGMISAKLESRCGPRWTHVCDSDVMGMMDELEELYNIDLRRTYLVGKSAGVVGCWRLAAYYPDRFAGVVALDEWEAGAPGHAQQGGPEPKEGLAAEVQSFLRASTFLVSFAENLAHCHVFAACKAGTQALHDCESRAIARRLRELGHDVEYLEFPGGRNDPLPGWVGEYALAKVLGAPPVRQPDHFEFRTADLRHNRAWWVVLDALDDPLKLSGVRASVSGKGVALVTDNVSALTLSAERLPPAVRTVSVDGASFAVRVSQPGVELEKWDGQWQLVERPKFRKRQRLSGPFQDVFRDPFLVVYATGGDSDLFTSLSRREAEWLVAQWEAEHGAVPRLKSDIEVTSADVRRFNIVLLGAPRVKGVVSGTLRDLPVGFEEDAIVLNGTRYAGEGLGVMLCYPNPASRARMIAVVGALGPAGLYQACGRFGVRLHDSAGVGHKWFDYAVFDNLTVGPDSHLVVGFFDNRWDFAQRGQSQAGGGAVWTRDAEAIAGLRPQGFPLLESAAGSEEPQVSLSDVRPTEIGQQGAVAFDRAFDGRAIRLGEELFDRGMGVLAPSSLSFRLGGQFSRFTAAVGPLEGTDARDVVFEVIGDGAVLATVRVPASGSQAAAAAISAAVDGVQALTLGVRTASHRTTGERLECAWADPTLTR